MRTCLVVLLVILLAPLARAQQQPTLSTPSLAAEVRISNPCNRPQARTYHFSKPLFQKEVWIPFWSNGVEQQRLQEHACIASGSLNDRKKLIGKYWSDGIARLFEQIPHLHIVYIEQSSITLIPDDGYVFTTTDYIDTAVIETVRAAWKSSSPKS